MYQIIYYNMKGINKMGMSIANIEELISRGQAQFDKIKANLD